MTGEPRGGTAWRWVLGSLLLLALAWWVHRSLGWRNLLQPWGQLPPGELAGALFLVAGSYAVRAVRVWRYFWPDTRQGYRATLRLTLIHNLLNNLLPARTGEASFPLLMKGAFQIPLSRSLPALLYFRFLDLHFLLTLAGVSVLAGAAAGGWGALALLLAPLPWWAFRLQGRLASRLEKREGKIRDQLSNALAGLPSRSSVFWETWGWTALNWGAKLLVYAWILRAFFPMPMAPALVGSATGELSSVLPVHGVAGAGTYEAGVVAGLVLWGVPPRDALQAAVNLHLFVLGASALCAALGLLLPARGPATRRR